MKSSTQTLFVIWCMGFPSIWVTFISPLAKWYGPWYMQAWALNTALAVLFFAGWYVILSWWDGRGRS